MFQLAELKVGIKFICYTNFGPKNDDTTKLKYIQKPTKSFACDEDTKACKKRLHRLTCHFFS